MSPANARHQRVDKQQRRMSFCPKGAGWKTDTTRYWAHERAERFVRSHLAVHDWLTWTSLSVARSATLRHVHEPSAQVPFVKRDVNYTSVGGTDRGAGPARLERVRRAAFRPKSKIVLTRPDAVFGSHG